MSDNNKGFGRDFERALSEGMENNNWTLLNDVIIKSVDNFLDGVGDKMNSAMEGHAGAVPLSERSEDFSKNTQTARRQRQLHAERQQVRERMERERKEREAARRAARAGKRRSQLPQPVFPYNNVGAPVSTTCTIIGGIGTGVFGVAMSIAALTGGMILVPVLFFGGFAALLTKGVASGKTSALADRYVQVIGNRQYIDIKTLALSMNRTEKRVVRELKKLLKLGYFPQGHLDPGNTTFILTDEVFGHYLELASKENRDDIIDTTARSEDEQEFPTLSPEESSELSRMIREGNDYILRFHALNENIPGIEISAKLDRLEGLLKEIFASIRKHPEQMSRIHELMDYYLPTAVKLVDAYREYDRVSEPGKEILSAKQDIENTLDTINEALGKLLNKLFKDSVLDVTTDAQVLKTVLAQKGLSDVQK